ncbi:hypothetical protein ONS95_001765 [Cadophora gregata]|uniref:uncharacterized protein n=1 Tax=Cadophora gregata TaxID=51156 RepID=UPI0026DC2914|nr:uncharacterized protein ONS95_001765 [Cadophora gregata]KAK0111404.1 hypothetical protein ONS95_001765 [Cadophora gregata]
MCPSLSNVFHVSKTKADRYRPPGTKPKPNTRFLRNIIKDTDNHNAALLAKEAAESRARLQSLASSPQQTERARGAGDIRRRQLGDIAAILGGRSAKRRRVEEVGTEGRRPNTSSEDDELEEKPRVKRAREENRDSREDNDRPRSHRAHRRRDIGVSEERDHDRERRRDRSRSRSPREHRSKDKESRHRHRSPRRKRSRTPTRDRSRERSHRSHRHHRSPSRERKSSNTESKKPESKPDYDSDPLDDIIGPRPPPIPEVKRKGRGTISNASGIDSRFSANYDPTADVQLDFDEENDWDQALEALKDRQKWKQQGADRLRAAGFTEEEVSKWERGGEKREEDVKWSKRGEGREWDRGKVIDGDGAVSIEPKFGRLTND